MGGGFKFNLGPGDFIKIKVEGREGYVWVKCPVEGDPIVAVNTSDLIDKEERFALTHLIVLVED